MKQSNDEITKLLAERSEYGEAWALTSRWIQSHILKLARVGDYAFLLIMIVNKVHRALSNPNNIDHWYDIQGYAQLGIDEVLKQRVPEQQEGYPEHG